MKKLLVHSIWILLLVGCSFRNVDVNQPVAVANKFYGALESGDTGTALNQFAPEFKKEETTWPRLLNGLQDKYGPVTAAELEASSLGGMDSVPCYTLNYAVKRSTLASREILFLCAGENAATWLIRGHTFTRLDTQQTITGGLMVQAVGVHVP